MGTRQRRGIDSTVKWRIVDAPPASATHCTTSTRGEKREIHMYRVGTHPPRLEVLETLPVVHSREVCRCRRHLSLKKKKVLEIPISSGCSGRARTTKQSSSQDETMMIIRVSSRSSSARAPRPLERLGACESVMTKMHSSVDFL